MERSKNFFFTTASPAETTRLGENIGRRILGGICLSLAGSLGAGKTVLIGGICRGLGVDEPVLSPTFILYEEFAGRMPVVHIDLYRLEHESEIEELGVFDLLGGDRVILAEWGDRSDTLMARSDAVINISQLSATERRFDVTCTPHAADVFENGES